MNVFIDKFIALIMILLLLAIPASCVWSISIRQHTIENIIKEYTNECSQKWSSFETRVLQVDEKNRVLLDCQVFYKEQWIPSGNIVFDLSEE